MTENMTSLRIRKPALISDVITEALKDITKVEKAKDMEVDMGTWYSPVEKGIWPERANESNTCLACFAGAYLMYNASNFDKGKSLELHELACDGNAYKIAHALNELRTGDVKKALVSYYGYDSTKMIRLTRKYNASYLHLPVCDYAVDPKQFKLDMRRIRDFLKSQGL